ncbi:MAG: LuxR family transcriptional regulator [Hyphomicrobium sp.]|jgi:DNA-binding CsgD family transcriptional regulator|uniref:LuxR family transcriptional regulator n=1 Tax=Hyphomicrobium sp. TaxID=82 RepID=UPI0025BBB0E9|nr:LuxR family transcriptional regulator [Hyphomicrobium sp.]MBX9863583.1 LuxR family transcriptional regulator [Hyphomicrobium sp.]
MLEKVFFQLVEDLDNVVSSDLGDDTLKAIASRYGLSNASYLGVNIPRVKDPAYILTSYSRDWVHRYVSQDYVSIDPVIQVGLGRILPLDWSDVRDHTPAARNFFGESIEFGLGHQGLSIPIRGANNETAMFSLNADWTSRRWKAEQRRIRRDFLVISNHFHNRVLEQLGAPPPDFKLTTRELECLKWAANGKSAFDISVILCISERLVRYHFECVRSKMQVSSIIQAVARAIKLNLI